MSRIDELHDRWSRDPDYRRSYEALALEFDLARAIIGARKAAGLTQAALARRMQTTQSVVARLEGGRVSPSTRTLQRIAEATGTRLAIRFQPVSGSEKHAEAARRATGR